jgi:hypothetical protein
MYYLDNFFLFLIVICSIKYSYDILVFTITLYRNNLLASLLGCLLSIRRSIEGKTEKVMFIHPSLNECCYLLFIYLYIYIYNTFINT